MTRKPDVQYIRYYTDGNAAKQIQFKLHKSKHALAKAPRQHKQVKTLYMDPLALGGIVISIVMLVLMIVGTVELFSIRQQADQMENYVTALYVQNMELKSDYESGYDLEEIESVANALGLVPMDENTVTVSIPEHGTIVKNNTLWHRVSLFFADLFA